ncbi:MAG: flagellar M-ring protein FliF [Chlamydiia bacterium]|nr:flagellar M-ring protein FliF [Chlamydiia bacterium]
MDLEFIRTMGQQLAAVWRELKVYQKFTVIAVAITLATLLTFMVVNAASTRFTPLYPAERLLISDAAEVKAYLDTSRIPYKLRGDTQILVPEGEVHKVRMDLAAMGLPKMQHGKGFELFDTNTWIKGEKELQVLEMRALKGQLEKDISDYENIRSANVILDIAPPRPFGGSMYKTKASVILTLMPGARLSNPQLRAITFHVAGAVRGLMPNMVAISDTTGKLYQAIDPDNEIDMLRSAEIGLEERLKAKIDGMLAMVVGHQHYYSTVQVRLSREKRTQERKVFSGKISGVDLGEPVIMSVQESGLQLSEKERAEIGTPGTNTEAVAGAVTSDGAETAKRDEQRNAQYRQMAVPMDHVKTATSPGKVESISIGGLIDKSIAVDAGSDLPADQVVDGRRNAQLLKAEIESQLAKIVEGYGVTTQPAVDFVAMDHTAFNEKARQESWSTRMDLLSQTATVLLALFTVGGMLWTLNRFWRRHMLQPPALDADEDDDHLEFIDEPSVMEVEVMVEAIKTRFQSDPNTVVETIRDWIADRQDLTPAGS